MCTAWVRIPLWCARTSTRRLPSRTRSPSSSSLQWCVYMAVGFGLYSVNSVHWTLCGKAGNYFSPRDAALFVAFVAIILGVDGKSRSREGRLDGSRLKLTLTANQQEGGDYFKLTHRKAAATPLSSCLARVALIKESLLTEGSPAYFRTLCILSTQKCLVCGLVKLALAGCSLTVLPGCVWVLLNYVLHTILGSLYNHTKCVA